MTTLGHQKVRRLLPLLTKCLLRSQGQKQAANNASCKRCLSSPPSAAEVDNSLGLPEQWKPPQEEGEAAVEDKQEASRYLQQLRRMYRCPSDENTVRYPFLFTELARPVVSAVVQNLDVQRHDYVLEIGFGQGEGLKMVWDRVRAGQGAVFGLEMSDAMLAEVRRDLVEPAAVPFLPSRIILSKTTEIPVLPYPDAFFDAIFHVNVFYFWPVNKMRAICAEIRRTLKPGRRLVCGMELAELQKLEKLGILRPEDFDPMRYTQALEPAGFEDIRISYEPLDSSAVHSAGGDRREVLLVSARRPLIDRRLEEGDPEEIWRRLEADIADDLVVDELTGYHGPLAPPPVAQPEAIRRLGLGLRSPLDNENRREKKLPAGGDENPAKGLPSPKRADHPMQSVTTSLYD